jgi:hypothetical protein
VSASGDNVGDISMADVDRTEMDLEKTILMIEEQENVVPALMLEQKNTNEDIEPYGHIDGGDILNFTHYILLPHPSFQVERMGVVFGSNL